MVFQVKFEVQIFVGEQRVEPSDVTKLVIRSKTIDRIVNDIFDHYEDEPDEEMDTDVTLSM